MNIVLIPGRWKKMSLSVNGVSHICLALRKMLFGCCYCSQFSPYFTAMKEKKKKRSAERMIPPRGGMGRQLSDLVPSFSTGTTKRQPKHSVWLMGARCGDSQVPRAVGRKPQNPGPGCKHRCLAKTLRLRESSTQPTPVD